MYPNAPVAAQVLQVYQLLRRELLIAREGWGYIDLFKMYSQSKFSCESSKSFNGP